jgi:hypothetical protein
VCDFKLFLKVITNNSFKGDWYYAKYDCTSKGMELVSIETIEEQLAIVAEISMCFFNTTPHSIDEY